MPHHSCQLCVGRARQRPSASTNCGVASARLCGAQVRLEQEASSQAANTAPLKGANLTTMQCRQSELRRAQVDLEWEASNEAGDVASLKGGKENQAACKGGLAAFKKCRLEADKPGTYTIRHALGCFGCTASASCVP